MFLFDFLNLLHPLPLEILVKILNNLIFLMNFSLNILNNLIVLMKFSLKNLNNLIFLMKFSLKIWNNLTFLMKFSLTHKDSFAPYCYFGIRVWGLREHSQGSLRTLSGHSQSHTHKDSHTQRQSHTRGRRLSCVWIYTQMMLTGEMTVFQSSKPSNP